MASIQTVAVTSLRVENLQDGGVTAAGGAGRSVGVVMIWKSAHSLAAGAPPFDLYSRSYKHVDSALEFRVELQRVVERLHSNRWA